MKYGKMILIIALAFLFSSCYHAQITTDKAPSNQVIDKPWASSFVFGLVPPNVVETASKCPNGLSKVETKISFLNGLVSGLTFNLYTPMHLTVTCAAGSGSAMLDGRPDNQITIENSASDKEKAAAFNKASQRSIDTGEAVYVAFD